MRAKKKPLEHALVDAEMNGLTLAVATGLSVGTVVNIRAGRIVERKTALTVCAVLKRPLLEIFEDEDAALEQQVAGHAEAR